MRRIMEWYGRKNDEGFERNSLVILRICKCFLGVLSGTLWFAYITNLSFFGDTMEIGVAIAVTLIAWGWFIPFVKTQGGRKI